MILYGILSFLIVVVFYAMLVVYIYLLLLRLSVFVLSIFWDFYDKFMHWVKKMNPDV